MKTHSQWILMLFLLRMKSIFNHRVWKAMQNFPLRWQVLSICCSHFENQCCQVALHGHADQLAAAHLYWTLLQHFWEDRAWESQTSSSILFYLSHKLRVYTLLCWPVATGASTKGIWPNDSHTSGNVTLINPGIAGFLVKSIPQTVKEISRFSVGNKLNFTQTLFCPFENFQSRVTIYARTNLSLDKEQIFIYAIRPYKPWLFNLT